MQPITGLFIFALLFSIILGTFCITEIFRLTKIKLTELQKKLITAIVGVILCCIWYFANINKCIDLLILTFFGAVGFYDIIIKTITKEIGGKYESEDYESKDNTSTR